MSGTSNGITSKRVGEILWRQRLVCAVVALIILAVGSAVVLTRPKVYQSTSSVALLPVATNPGILPNYPNLIISLIPTYVQLISSPVLLNQVAAKLPFHITEAQLSSDVHAESLSNAAIIDIVAENPNPAQAKEIASAATVPFSDNCAGTVSSSRGSTADPLLPTSQHHLGQRRCLVPFLLSPSYWDSAPGCSGIAWLAAPPVRA